MSTPAALAALPGLIRATRRSVEQNAPTEGMAGVQRAMLLGLLLYAEITADMLVEMVPEAVKAPAAPPQQIHAPLADHVEPRVPRWPGHDSRLPPGQPHP